MFENFQNFVPKISHQLNLNKQLVSSTICHISREELRNNFPEIAEHIVIVSFSEGVLKVKASNNTVLSELHYIKTDLKEKINLRISENALLKAIKLKNILATI
jgi:hypothetical protein